MSNAAPAASAERAADWLHTLGRQWWHLQWLKAIGIGLFMWLFFVAYFHLLNHPQHTVTVMPLTALDDWIGFQPAAFWVYVSLWLYVGIPPAFMPSLRTLLGYGVWISALCLTGLLIFYLWPTAVPSHAHQLDPAVIDHPGFALLRGVDAAGNACPSMHVASAIFSACWTQRLLSVARAPAWPRWLNAGWFVLIAWSTVAVRQHVVLDVLAGAALGAAFAALSLRCMPAPGPATSGQRL